MKRQARAVRPGARKWLAAVSVTGELFLTAGIICFLFLGWQLWLNDLVVGAEQQTSAKALEDEWRTPGSETVPPTREASDVDYGEPVVATAPPRSEERRVGKEGRTR